MSKKGLLEEVGHNYRFFLGWRHAALGGGIAVLWGALSLLGSASSKGLEYAWAIPAGASFILVILGCADHRTRQIYRALVEAGKALEDEPGPYHALSKLRHDPAKRVPLLPASWTATPPCNTEECSGERRNQQEPDPPQAIVARHDLNKLWSHSTALDLFFFGFAVIMAIVAVFTFVNRHDAS